MTLTRAENTLIKGGAVFLMKDEVVVFPEARLEGAGPRNLHEFRWAIVLQGPGDYQALDYPLVNVIPCSSSSTPARGTFPLPQEELQREGSPFSAANVLAYTNLVQPCLKIELIKHQGNLLPDTYGRLCAHVLRVLGLVSAARGNPPTPGGLVLPPRISTSSSKLRDQPRIEPHPAGCSRQSRGPPPPMPSLLEGAPRASFDTIEFPFTSRGARLEFREHTHEFPKMAGGQPEKLGRRLWVFSFECPFHASNLHFPNLYPAALDALTERAARGYTAELVIPEMGILRAFITKLDRRRRGAILSGEDVTLEFKEDDLEAFRNATTPVGRVALDEASANVRAEMLGFGADDRDLDSARIDPYREPLGRLLGLVDSVLAIRDQVELFGARVGALLEGIAANCRELHELLKGPDLSPLRESLRSLWDATHQLQQDLLNKGPGSSLVTYVVPAVMSVGQIAQQLYGDASRGPELLSLNASIADPFQVDAGLSLVVYAD